jgi:hypothetical protein
MYVTFHASNNGYLQNQWIGAIFPRRDVFSYIIIHNIYCPPGPPKCDVFMFVALKIPLKLVWSITSIILNKWYFKFHAPKHELL